MSESILDKEIRTLIDAHIASLADMSPTPTPPELPGGLQRDDLPGPGMFVAKPHPTSYMPTKITPSE